MKTSSLVGRRVLAAFTLMFGVAALGSAPLHASKPDKNSKAKGGGAPVAATTYSAHAIGVRIDGVTHPVAGPIVIADTGALPVSGGTLTQSESNVNIANGGLTVAHADASASGVGPEAAAESTLTNYRAEFVVTDGGHTHRAVIAADYIHAAVSASVAPNGRVSLRSAVNIQGLTVNGQAIVVTGQANQRVDLPHEVGGYLIINDQASAGTGADGDIGVTAIRFHVCHCIDGHLGFVHAGITPGGNVPPPEEHHDCGKLTGGGWILDTPSGAKGTFAVSGGIRRGEFWGHLNYNDHGTGMKVKSTAVTGFSQDPRSANGRIITYNVTINGAPGTATVRAVDNGEPGRTDIFELSLSTGYQAGSELGGSRSGGGNIQLHKCPPGWE